MLASGYQAPTPGSTTVLRYRRFRRGSPHLPPLVSAGRLHRDHRALARPRGLPQSGTAARCRHGDHRRGTTAATRLLRLRRPDQTDRLAEDWPKDLEARGFDRAAPTIWLIEGLLQYLDAPDVDRLFARVDALSAPGSVLLYDVVGTALLEAPFSAATLAYMEKLGAPWVFSSDAPAELVEGRGWPATVTDMAVPGHKWKRWAHPPVPAEVPNAPRDYFVEAIKA
jgi:hypothetical protein